jgi:hypothetical protein
MGWDYIDWIVLAQGRDKWRAFVNTIMNLPVQQNVRIFFSSCATSCFSSRTQLHGAG